MQWSASSLILLIYTHFLLVEVEQRRCLITLRCNMEHVESEEILSIFVSTILHQGMNSIHVSFKGCKVQRGELVLHCSRVNPCPDIMIFSFLNLFR